ncbi:hypothetical protein Vadar_025578 [Vaccinium darrowii]|uniref:Uncharacterized protein n=1 Tax=Vaccinium darrowii TaxID=229202 RepID=A0ACB7XCB1_9ERIC|nr:hypothetical protein Vadar_025578 [Vaccinium darrowii]
MENPNWGQNYETIRISKEGNGSANQNNLFEFGSFAGWLDNNNLPDPQFGQAVPGFGFNEYGGEYNNNPYHSQLYRGYGNQYASWERNTYTGEAQTSSFHCATLGGSDGGHGQSPPTNVHVGSSAGGWSGPTLDTYCGTSVGPWGGHGQSPPPSHGSRQYDNWEVYVQRSWDEGYGYGTDDHLEEQDDMCSLPADDPIDREDERLSFAEEEAIEWEDDLQQEDDYETLRTMAVFHGLREQMDQGEKKKVPFHTSPLQGKEYMKDLFNSCEKRFYREMKMPKRTFCKIVEELETIYGWRMRRKNAITCYKAFAIFILLLRGKTNGDIQERMQHSPETVTRQVHKMLHHLEQFHNDKLKPTTSQDYIHLYMDR